MTQEIPTPVLDVERLEAASQEFADAWIGALDVWGAYLDRLAHATGPFDVFAAGARFWDDSLNICSRAAGAHLRAGGLRAPLLNDA